MPLPPFASNATLKVFVTAVVVVGLGVKVTNLLISVSADLVSSL